MYGGAVAVLSLTHESEPEYIRLAGTCWIIERPSVASRTKGGSWSFPCPSSKTPMKFYGL
jgi:hypothetical protein